MFSSNNSNNLISSYDSTPFSFESNHTCSKQYENETTIISCPPPPPPFSFFQFPYSPFEDNNQFFLQQQQQQQQHHDSNFQSILETSTTPLVVNNSTDASASASMNPPAPAAEQGKKIKELKQQIPTTSTTTRKRTSKRDRHSKIKTARGLRDRRMRLSLEVAKRFFGLQDMLGFEKASKTVEWLLNKSKVEIKELAKRKNLLPSCAKSTTTASSTSECEEGVSSLDEVVEREQTHTVVKVKKRSRVINKVFRKSAFSPIGREKARERARERTREKMKTKNAAAAAAAASSGDDESNSKQCNNVVDAKNNNISNLLWNPFETVEEEPSSQAKEHSGSTEDDNSLFIMSKWSPTMIFNSLNNSGLILQEHQFAQFESLEKPWEDYNNRI